MTETERYIYHDAYDMATDNGIEECNKKGKGKLA